jgi:hypothetical protein
MSVERLLEKAAFGPEEITQMRRAYELALQKVGVADPAGPLADLIAAKIVAISQAGERDPVLISKRAVMELGIPLGE